MFDLYWTSKEPLRGLRHFVLVDRFKIKGKWKLLLVSVLDNDISYLVCLEEFKTSENWESGWKDLNKEDSVTVDYMKFKKEENKNKIVKLYIKGSSPFNIS